MTQPNIIEAERAKYQKMWLDVPGYRVNSPGERLVPKFLELAKWQKGDELIDCGSGPGRAAKLLSDAGLDVTMLDIAPSATDPGVNLPFIEACLWDMADVWPGRFDWVFCCDVLEHIPTEHVDEVLDNLAHLTGKGAFLQIALWQETWGKQIGEILHLTVADADWWLEKLNERWLIIYQLDSGDGRLIVLTGAPFMVKKTVVKKAKQPQAQKAPIAKCPVQGCTSTPPCTKHSPK